MTTKTHPTQPIIIDDCGMVRFKENAIVKFLVDRGGVSAFEDVIGMEFSIEDRQQFAQLIGYTLDGYAQLPYVTGRAYYRASIRAAAVLRKSKK